MTQLAEAEYVTREWFRSSRNQVFGHLHTRWNQRATAMRMAPGTPPGLLVLPEAVTITEVFCDLEWRRHIAMAHSNVDLLQFYELIARRLGLSRKFGRRLAWSYYVDRFSRDSPVQ